MSAHPAQHWPVSIGEAARRAGVSARMVRHYEAKGLLPPMHRTDGGYRQYAEADVHALRFIRRGRDLGFSMDEIATLLGDRKSTRLNSSHSQISYAVFCLKKKKKTNKQIQVQPILNE